MSRPEHRVLADGVAAVEGTAIGKGGVRERILVEASELFARKGYRATGTREIASAVHIKQPSLFHHFSSKADIMRELMSHSLERPSAFATRMASRDGPATDRLYEYILFDTLHIVVSPYYLSGLEADDVMGDPEFRRWFVLREQLRNARELMVVQGINDGEFVDVGSEFATSVLTGVVLATLKTYSGRDVDRPIDLSRRIAAFALRGLLLKPEVLDTVSKRVLPPGSTQTQIDAALVARMGLSPDNLSVTV